ncbi:MAG: hypothetical protein GF317_11860, partial [Candidatus Lokiarchaeota archaeon]|nr:hypothetical protein [Candidatus Lokiarchaeota archaeon]MBD3200342.1 hypothetical protein [Candidatus Lokiarchaeota archaeon]
MHSKYKIVLLGPPESGKTTIEKVFFQRVNPFSLLNTPLEPTRGINSTSFSLFSSQLGIFDLAGQELDNWFSTQKEVFKETNIIICVFDILNSLEQIISILIKTIKICKEKCLND